MNSDVSSEAISSAERTGVWLWEAFGRTPPVTRMRRMEAGPDTSAGEAGQTAKGGFNTPPKQRLELLCPQVATEPHVWLGRAGTSWWHLLGAACWASCKRAGKVGA